jgi:hypothetical protein
MLAEIKLTGGNCGPRVRVNARFVGGDGRVQIHADAGYQEGYGNEQLGKAQKESAFYERLLP